MKRSGKIEYEVLRRSNRSLEKEIFAAVRRVIESGWYILGQEVEKFEQQFAAYLGLKNCVGVANGLDALILAIEALQLPRGSEILVAANTYIATIIAIIRSGHIPILVEPHKETFNINPKCIPGLVSNKTRAICVTHLFGKPCQMDEITKLSLEYDLKLIEDCAQSHGAKFKGQHTGTFGEIGCFSFYPTKNLGGLGDGGAIVTNNDSLAEYIRYVRNYGSKVKYHNKYVGCNSRLDEIQAAILSVKLARFESLLDHKRTLASAYSKKLPGWISTPFHDPDCVDAFHIYAVRHNKRNALREWLMKHDVKTEIHYPIPPYRQDALIGYFSGTYPISDELHETELSLPISYGTTLEEVNHISSVINEIDLNQFDVG